MSSEPSGQVSERFKGESGPSRLKLRVSSDGAGAVVARQYFSSDGFPPLKHGLAATVVDVGPGEVLETLVVTFDVVVIDDSARRASN